MSWGYAATLHRLYNGFPFVRAKPWGCNAGVGNVEDRYGEGLEGRCWRDGEVYYLELPSALPEWRHHATCKEAIPVDL